jgi:hypothetical protein
MIARYSRTQRILREVMLLRYLGRHDNLVEMLDVMTDPPHDEDFHTLCIVTTLFLSATWSASSPPRSS